MGAIHMFHDLPCVDLQEDEYGQNLTFAHAYESCWSPDNSSATMTDTVVNGGIEIPAQEQDFQDKCNIKHFLQSQEISYGVNSLPFGRNDFSKPYEIGRTLTMYDATFNSLPHNQTIPRDASPERFWYGDRPAIEQESSSGGSAWSPRTSEGCVEHEVGPTYSLCPWDTLREDSPFPLGSGLPPSIATELSYTTLGSREGIALREIQQYPDADDEVVLKRPDVDPAHEYDMESTATFQIGAQPVQLFQEDEGIGSSVHNESTTSSIKEEEDSFMEDNTKDNDDASDYSPTASQTRKPTRRTSRTTAASKPPTPPAQKRSTRTRPSKITKRASKPPAANLSISSNPNKATCPHCRHPFPSPSTLNKHILTTHTRPFTCPFARYSCTSTFGSKNEWKRHVSSQHLCLGIYRCDMGACVPHASSQQQQQRSHKSSSCASAAPPMKPAAVNEAGHNEFNRKDLFTQHIRRMHDAESASPTTKLDAIRDRCWVPLRDPPSQTSCGYCSSSSSANSRLPAIFTGPGSWDVRMEHVARHLEKGDVAGVEEEEDLDLRAWMEREGLLVWGRNGPGWTLEGGGGRRGSAGVRNVSGGRADDADADGEEDAIGEEE